MKYSRTCAVFSFLLVITGFFSQQSLAQTLLDERITGFDGAANTLQVQHVGPPRQIGFTPLTITSPTVITRIEQLSDSTPSMATSYEYAIRSNVAPYNLIESGPATLANRSTYANVTVGGNDSNLDQFTLTTSQLAPGTYFIAVYSSDGANAYNVISNTLVGDLRDLVSDSGGAPILVTGFHIYIRFFSAVGASSTTSVPALPPIGLLLLGAFLGLIAFRSKRAQNKTS
ncbi:IPTL-CTERM sorting domain-containing protein [uncultured Pseudoteredinibacter sp.]|uniref:IPTL-CTERM sorting domain-containing protein n=1 Tax=uncultured Pseudoteredinibacter sp. TaxID=1641701 RepID=UPI0026346013|nr:IPTL-CTERM sorting domain-containing protein [uncultured Pseudoteredinibacter sp.]